MAGSGDKGKKGRGLVKDPLWYKDAIIYELHVRSFADSNADGIGDFPGLTSRLDYLHDLGVTAIWVLPFYPSPLKDDGYDIADYYEINPIYGTLDDFKIFLHEAHRRGLRVVTELVINHTSDQHSWFQKSRRAMARLSAGRPPAPIPGRPPAPGTAPSGPVSIPPEPVPPAAAHPNDYLRDYYVWTHDPTRYKEVRIIFKDFEPSNWTWDPLAQAYYWHRFFSHQPDLNFDNPAVHEEIIKVIDYWCDMGVDGFRLDAIPYLYEREGTSGESLRETHEFIKKLRAHVDAKYGDRVFLAEANQWPEEAVTYFGGGRGDECHMAFHFPVMPRLFMAVRMEDRVPIVDILEQTPPLPETSQWAIFLRNHDELTLEMVTDEERDYMYRVYAHENKARINLGIRRRLAPLLGNDRNKIELLNLLLLSLPGTPVIYYGDEIGMGDNIYLGDRNGVRTPMHWSSDKNAGFSRASPQALQLPIIVDPEYHYEAINVETQQRNPNSLLWWTKRTLALRKKWKAFGRGSLQFLHPENRKVLAFLRQHEQETILVVANLSRFPQPVELDLAAFEGIRPLELFGRTKFPVIGRGPYPFTLSPHAAFWFSLERKHPPPEARAAELPVVTVESDWREVLDGPARDGFELALTSYLPQRPWFAGKGRELGGVIVRDIAEAGGENLVLVIVTADFVGTDEENYFLAVGFTSDETRVAELPLIARITGGVTGILYDAVGTVEFGEAVLRNISHKEKMHAVEGEFVAAKADGLQEICGEGNALLPVTNRHERSNTTVIFGDQLFLKLFRRMDYGVNPHLEMSRFLTERGFQHIPRLGGAIEYHRAGESASVLMITGVIPNSRTAWHATFDALGRFYDRVRTLPAHVSAPQCEGALRLLTCTPMAPEIIEVLGTYVELARLLGQRTAELHVALASDPENKEFAPEPFTPFYQRGLYQSMRNRTLEVLGTLRTQMNTLPSEARDLATKVVALQDTIVSSFRGVHQEPIDMQRIRIHGDYHLAQVLYTGKDFVIIDLEGEWSRPVSERRIKRSALRDVAGMIRSFHYIAHRALRHQQEIGSFDATQAERVQPWLRFWSRWVSSVFLRGYLEAVAPAQLLPRNEVHLDLLLSALLLDRALGELTRELNSRPESAHIPLRGIIDLVGPATT